MEAFYPALLAVCAFWLGACPFSVWIGRWLLGKDVREYGDGNPGAANVFRAGGLKSGFLAVVLDIAKGVPFVLLAHSFFGLPEAAVMAVAVSPLLGHAFSPILRLKGGKAVAVTFGVLMALPQPDILFTYTILTVLGFLFIMQHSWVALSGPIGTFIYLLISRGVSWELLFMLCVLTLFIIKQRQGLQSLPVFKMNLINWLQSRRRET